MPPILPLRSRGSCRRDHSHSGNCQRLHDVTPEPFEQLVDLIPEPYASMVFMVVWTGLRVSELIGLIQLAPQLTAIRSVSQMPT